MAGIAVVGSMTSGHDGYPPVRVIEGSDFVTCNGVPVALVGSRCEEHTKPHNPTHYPVVTGGSSFVSVGGIKVATIGSEVAGGGCNASHVIVTGDESCNIEN